MTGALTSVRPELVEGRPTSEAECGLRQPQAERGEGWLPLANLLALLVPTALLAGAWGFQLIGGYQPCEMCHWQRWPHYAALPVAALAFLTSGRTRVALVALAALLIAASGVIGVMHLGVERHWWQGFTACTATNAISGATAAERLSAILNQPIVRCDAPAWTLCGVSMAGFNALFSLGGAAAVATLLLRRAR